MPAQDLHTLLDRAPAAGQVVLVALLVAGLLVWLFGHKLVKPLGVTIGLALGAAAGLAIAHALGATLLFVWAGLGGAIGAALAWLLFRVWMGIALGVVLAVALPVAVVAVMGVSTPSGPVDVKEQFLEFKKDVEDDRPLNLQERVGAIYEQQRDEAKAWWESLGGSGRKRVIGCAIGGALVGLLVGLIRPKLGAGVVAALLGGTLIVLAGERLLAVNAPNFYAKLPTGPRVTLAALGLITILGLALQWTFSKRQADK